MTVGSRRVFMCATAITVCLLAAAGLRAASAEAGAAAQAAPAAQNAGERVEMVEDVFKTVVLLRGIPVDTFFEAMGMFANAMGNDCTFCHASNAALDKAAFATPTPRLQRARQMITMVNAINKQYFNGAPRVTCFTCHAGSNSPKADPSLMVQYGVPMEDPNARDFVTDTRINPNQVFDRYIQALGGAGPLAKLTSFTAKGTYAGFDTSMDKVPMELYAKAPGQHTMVVHLGIGASTRVFDGRSGWISGPEQPLPLLTLTQGNLDRARLEGLANFAVGLRNAYPNWRGGRTAIDDKELLVLQATENNEPVVQLYFDSTGLLVRFVRFTRTPVGFVPTQLDFADYRDVQGVKVPFKRTVTQTYMQMSVEFTDLQPNTNIPASRFVKPAPAKLQG